MLGPVGEIDRTYGTELAWPVSGTIDQDSDIDMEREWVGRVGLKRQEIKIEATTLVEDGGSVSPRNWAGTFWILFGGMAGLILQANTISVPGEGSIYSGHGWWMKLS